MKELLIDGFILRMKHQLNETEINYDEFKNLIENIYKFTDKFPELKGRIKNEFNSNISDVNIQSLDVLYRAFECDVNHNQKELANILSYEKTIRAPSHFMPLARSEEMIAKEIAIVKRQKSINELNEQEKEKYDEIFNKMVKSKDFLMKIHNLKM